jgi:hypothetical protein
MIIILLGILIALAYYINSRPSAFNMERSITINAKPEKIIGFVNDLHNWDKWSPWEKMDPTMQKKYSGAEKGVGSIYEWVGNNKVGQGRMEILESSPKKVTVKLDFLKPFEAHNMTDLVLEPEGDTTKVRWVMTGNNNFMSKAMHMVVSMDKLVGKDFENGLAALKEVSEK